MTTRIAVDFNSVDPDGYVRADTDNADEIVELGDTVLAYDPADGTEAFMRVARWRGSRLSLAPTRQGYR